MKTVNWLTGVCFLCAVATAISHPSSGIVVYEQKEMFFVHSGRGLAKLDQAGNLAYPHQSTDGHWLCLDPNGSFSRTQSKHFDQQVNRGHAVPSFGFGKWWNASDPTLHLCGIRSFAAKHSRMKRSVKIMKHDQSIYGGRLSSARIPFPPPEQPPEQPHGISNYGTGRN